MLIEYFDQYAKNHLAYKGGPWCYEDGLIYRGLEMLHKTTGDERWLDHIIRMIDTQLLDGPELSKYNANDYNIDNILPGRTLLYLYAQTGDKKYLDGAALLADQLNTQPRTQSGVYWHKLRYPWQVWLDGLYMGQPFQIEYAQVTNQPGLVDDSIQQISTALDMAYVEETNLFAHAVDEARKQRWANSDTGHSAAHWARALGWLAMALVDVAELVGPTKFQPLSARTETFLKDIYKLRSSEGLWLQVIDQPDLEGNYEETSASAMFVYALYKGQKLGLWDGQIDEVYDTLISNAIKPKEGGGQEMVDVVWVAGLGMFENRYRDGSAEYYISEKLRADDPKGVGPLMMVSAFVLAERSEKAEAAE